jgi:hypothetical protein
MESQIDQYKFICFCITNFGNPLQAVSTFHKELFCCHCWEFWSDSCVLYGWVQVEHIDIVRVIMKFIKRVRELQVWSLTGGVEEHWAGKSSDFCFKVFFLPSLTWSWGKSCAVPGLQWPVGKGGGNVGRLYIYLCQFSGTLSSGGGNYFHSSLFS